MSCCRMPFGAHRGAAVRDLPSDYLQWLLTIELSSARLRRAVEDEAIARGLRARRPYDDISGPEHPSCPDTSIAEAVITAGFHKLAREAHPDLGGDARRMQAVNDVVAWLRDVVREETTVRERVA